MSDDLHYGSRSDSKRKFDDSLPSPPPALPQRRTTGFSAPITSSTSDSPAPTSYNSVPPPMDEIQIAKQRAQEIAARLFSNAEAKRPRVENGSGEDAADHPQKSSGLPMSGSQAGSLGFGSHAGAYGYQATTKKIDIPNGRVGVIIGKSGETIKYLQLQSGAKIQVTRDMDADPYSPNRPVELTGTPDQISKAEQLINEVLTEAEAGGSGILAARRSTTAPSGTEQFVMKVPNNKVGIIIGKGGETIKNMQSKSGARIQIIPLHPPPGDTSNERTVQMDGTKEQLEIAKQLVNEVISDNRVRNPTMGGYPQQGYQPPPTSWGPPGPPQMAQSGYGYMQPGTYPGQPPQYYGTSQPPYGGYPSQPTSTGFSSSWDQNSGGAPTSQGSQGGGGYDYYNQQPQQSAPGGAATAADGTAYSYGQTPGGSYNQPPPYGQDAYSGYSQPPAGQPQAYGQDAYGGYQAPPAYGQQPTPNPQPGYEQYGSASTTPYGNKAGSSAYGSQPSTQGTPPQAQTLPPTSQPPPAGGAQSQGYGNPPPSSAPSYSSQAPPTQPADYAMPPSSQPNYATQPPPVQQGYGQPPSYGQQPASQKPPVQVPYGQGPTSQGSYPAPTQAGYAHTQPTSTPTSYTQPPDASQTWQGPMGYGSSQSGGYSQQPYGAPASQASYGQPPYGDSYNSYPQQPVYSGDGAASGNAHSGHDAPPGASPAVKASPQSQG